jgi:acid phosphatase (class A)
MIDNRRAIRAFRCLLVVAVVAAVNARVIALEHFLTANKPDVVSLLAPPPEAGSAEQAADLATTVAAHKHATKEEMARADAEEKKLGLENFTAAIGPTFQIDKLPKTQALLTRAQKEAEDVVDLGKEHWQRPRPYQVDPADLHHGSEKKPSFSYPSGHSTQATVLALLLAELYPERREAILAVGRQVGWDRVMLGRHYPTDIYAGRVLAQAIVRELHANPEFEHEFAAAKAEVDAAQK